MSNTEPETFLPAERYVVLPLGAGWAVWDRLFEQWDGEGSGGPTCHYRMSDAQQERDEIREQTIAAGLRVTV